MRMLASPALALLLPLSLVAACAVGGLLLRQWLAGRLAARPDAPPLRRLSTEAARRLAVPWSVGAGAYAVAAAHLLPYTLELALPTVLFLLLVGSVTWTLARLAADLVGAQASVGGLPSATLIGNLARAAVLAAGLLILMQRLGISVTPLITALGIGGLAVALALQDTLSNLFAGIYVLASRQIRTGDYLRLESGQEGYVEDVAWRYTRIRQLGGNILIVPNAKLAAAVTTNFNRPSKRLRLAVGFGVGLAEDLDRVERVASDVAAEVAREVPGCVRDFAPVVLFQAVDEAGVRFEVVLECEEVASQARLRHELIKRLHRRCLRDGIGLAAGSRPAVPAAA